MTVPGEESADESFTVRGEPAAVDAAVDVDGKRYVLARTQDETVAVEHRHLSDDDIERIAREEGAGVYQIDG